MKYIILYSVRSAFPYFIADNRRELKQILWTRLPWEKLYARLKIWKYVNMVKVTNEAIGENTVSDL